MALEEFINLQPQREFALAAQIAQHIHQNFSEFLGNHYYIHLADAGGGSAVIDEVQDLKKVPHAWTFVYVEREKTACIIIRSHENKISMLMCGEYEWADYTVTATGAVLTDGPRKSILPSFRKCTLTPMQRLEAFGFIEQALHESKGNKAG